MDDDGRRKVEIVLGSEAIQMLETCASWRGLSAEELAKAYVEDWLGIDYPESQGRLTRRSIYRDGPIGLSGER